MSAVELDLDAIEARADDATEGPWQAVNDPSDDGGYPECSVGVATGDETFIFEDMDTLRADAEFIAAARADVPALVAEVRRLRTDLANARRQAVEAVIADRTNQTNDPDVAHAVSFTLEMALRPWLGPHLISEEHLRRIAARLMRSAEWVRPAAPGCDCSATGGQGLAPTASREHADDCPAGGA